MSSSTLRVPHYVAVVRRSWQWVWGCVKLACSWCAHTVTPAGLFVVAVTAAAAVCAFALNWVEAWYVTLTGAVLLAAGVPFLLGGRAYAVRIAPDTSRVVVGGAIHLGIDIENASARPALPATAELPVGRALREIPIPLMGPPGSIG